MLSERHDERELENALIEHLTRFLVELVQALPILVGNTA
jgi:predicted nuclease of restriction endonuclease-like (RecB) superfamily